jgi:hypothetical protein
MFHSGGGWHAGMLLCCRANTAARQHGPALAVGQQSMVASYAGMRPCSCAVVPPCSHDSIGPRRSFSKVEERLEVDA